MPAPSDDTSHHETDSALVVDRQDPCEPVNALAAMLEFIARLPTDSLSVCWQPSDALQNAVRHGLPSPVHKRSCVHGCVCHTFTNRRRHRTRQIGPPPRGAIWGLQGFEHDKVFRVGAISLPAYAAIPLPRKALSIWMVPGGVGGSDIQVMLAGNCGFTTR